MYHLPTKAIITAAGTGTRFLPATKVMAKEMLPLIDKPIIQYSVEELADSGIKDIIMVTKKDRHVISDHFDSHVELEHYLKKTNKQERLKTIKDLTTLANIVYVVQKSHMPYGNATPLLISQKLIDDDEAFLYLFGDDVTLSTTPVCQQLIDVYKKNRDAAAIIAVQKIPRNLSHLYGIVKIKKGSKNILEKIIEKPGHKDAPSNLAEFGRLLLTPKILPIINRLKTGKGGELWLVDAIHQLAQTEKILIHQIKGKWFTTGDPLTLLKTTLEFALARSDLKKDLKKFLVDILKK